MMRRLFGILLAASMAHLALAGSNPSCASQSGHATPDHAAMAGVHHHDGGQSQKPPCKTPTHSDCCATAMSSSSSVGPSAVVTRQALIALHADAPLPARVAPEPPPPKV